jgi:hypothetical protein
MQRRRSVRVRILVLVLIPVIALVALYGVIVNITLGDLLSLGQAAGVRDALTNPTTNVQRQLAAERSIAVAYLAGIGHAEPPTSLAIQQHATDLAVQSFDHAAARVLGRANVPLRRAILSFRRQLWALSELRALVASQRLTPNDAAGSYSAMVGSGDNVLTQSILPLVSNAAGTQALDVVSLDQSLQAMLEEGDVVKADLTARSFSANDLTLINSLANSRRQLWDQALPGLDPVLQRAMVAVIPGSAAFRLTSMEQQIALGLRSALRVPVRTWDTAETAYVAGFRRALARAGNTLQADASGQSDSVLLRLILGGIGGLLVIALAVGVAIFVSRGLLLQLTDLRMSALDLASRGLPGAIARLRAGEDPEEEPRALLLEASPDEIGEVRQAFNAAAQTAIAAAVEEIRIRRGVNDVFRNLARRNQSLLTRQLELLDAMERRVDDPEQLGDLFRIDHLTTRMRRHAEGLLIIAGGSSGRTWRDPVPLVDVMRAAIAEVESYTRIRVSARTSAAIAGHAVADIIHLLAELLENATIFSPANTPVRIDGDRVARGLALEIEDRGLGISEERLAAINTTLSNPPLFDMSGGDQLGLFIVGLLARRHDIKITLRSSAYGGVIAVVLIPRSLVVDVAADGETGSAVSIRELGRRRVPQLTGPPASWGSAASGAAVAAAATTALADAPTTAPADVVPDLVISPEPAAEGSPAPPARGNVGNGTATPPPAAPRRDGLIDGLPVRVRQANLAPQLADQARAGRTGLHEPQPYEPQPYEPQPYEPQPYEAPEAARTTMSAWQRGWERGRGASERLTEEDSPVVPDPQGSDGGAGPDAPGDAS